MVTTPLYNNNYFVDFTSIEIHRGYYSGIIGICKIVLTLQATKTNL